MINSPVNLFEIESSIDMDKFSEIFTADIKKVIAIIRKYGFDLRIVGGAVRDFIRGATPRDIDFATNAEPAELIFIFDMEQIEYDSSGIKHGTIKAKFGNDIIDVTSIVYKLKVQDQRIIIQHPHSWEQDSLNRDVTINSMSVDMEGNLYDYQNGLADLHNQLVKFCPNSQTKINQDPFTILRWFKAIALFDQPKWLKTDKRIIEKNANKAALLKDDERKDKFLSSLVTNKNGQKVFELMCATGVGKPLNINCNI
jgi:tRNA nucleotidyltransferase/poly(A) polymerase